MPNCCLTVNILLTASSNLSIDISPSLTCLTVFLYNAFQFSGTINISTPALNDSGQLPALQPGTC